MNNSKSIEKDNSTGSLIRLTPALFAELDHIARTEAGCVLSISTFDEINGWGRFNSMCGGAYIDARRPYGPGCMDDVQIIELAEEIDIASFRSVKRPELDWSGVPNEKIFQFVLYHEIGHKLNNFCPFDFMVSKARGRENERDLYSSLRWVNEILADRFAWERLFPNVDMPQVLRSTKESREIERRIAQLSEFVKIREIKFKALPTEPWSMIPAAFVCSDRYAHLLGNPLDPQSRAAILEDAWTSLRYYVAKADSAKILERVSPYLPTVDEAIIHRNTYSNKAHNWQIFEIPPDTPKHDSKAHRVTQIPKERRFLTRQDLFEEESFSLSFIELEGNRVYVTSVTDIERNDGRSCGYVYRTDDILNCDTLLSRMSSSDVQKLKSLTESADI
jgi:hypothetical protein